MSAWEVRLPIEELRFQFARSSGAGGQNVNKVESKAILRWDVAHSRALPEAVRARFLARFASRLTTRGELVLASQRHRDQGRNVDDCLDKLRALLGAVAQPPTPRRATRPGRAAVQRRLTAKRVQGERKRERRRPPREE